MASPVLSRSPSATFAPGPHRRSHPNLQNLHSLSLAPLTPKYPIDPADYDAYYDPATSELHSSTSLSQIAPLPSPGGILTNSPARSRNSSRVRKKAKSHVHIHLPEGVENPPADVDAVVGHKPASKEQAKVKTSQSQPELHPLRTDPSWLVQTGLSLTESSRENKGQSWISKRDSSTNLVHTPVEGYLEIKRTRDGRTPRSGRATPARSRATSRNASRNASRTRLQGLRMTSLGSDEAIAAKGTPTASFATAPEMEDQIYEGDEKQEDIQPNWADARAQAEMAAHLQAELEDEWEEDDGDPYGMLDFGEQGDSDDDDERAEEEVRRAMRSWRVGGWFDGAVEALLMVEEGPKASHSPSEPDVERGPVEDEEGEGQAEETGQMTSGEVEDVKQGARNWVDAYWFGRMIRRSAGL